MDVISFQPKYWKDGYALCSILHAFKPSLFNYNSLQKFDDAGRLQYGIDTGHNNFNIKPLFTAEGLYCKKNMKASAEDFSFVSVRIFLISKIKCKRTFLLHVKLLWHCPLFCFIYIILNIILIILVINLARLSQLRLFIIALPLDV